MMKHKIKILTEDFTSDGQKIGASFAKSGVGVEGGKTLQDVVNIVFSNL